LQGLPTILSITGSVPSRRCAACLFDRGCGDL